MNPRILVLLAAVATQATPTSNPVYPSAFIGGRDPSGKLRPLSVDGTGHFLVGGSMGVVDSGPVPTFDPVYPPTFIGGLDPNGQLRPVNVDVTGDLTLSGQLPSLSDGGCGAGFSSSDGGYWFVDCLGNSSQTGTASGADATSPHQFATLEQVQAFVVLPDAGGAEYDFFRIDGGALGPFGLTLPDAGTAFSVSGNGSLVAAHGNLVVDAAGDVILNGQLTTHAFVSGTSDQLGLNLTSSASQAAFITAAGGSVSTGVFNFEPDGGGVDYSEVIYFDLYAPGWAQGGATDQADLELQPWGDGGALFCVLNVNNRAKLGCVRDTGQWTGPDGVEPKDAMNVDQEPWVDAGSGAIQTAGAAVVIDAAGDTTVAGNIQLSGFKAISSTPSNAAWGLVLSDVQTHASVTQTFRNQLSETICDSNFTDGGGTGNATYWVIGTVDRETGLGLAGQYLHYYNTGGDGGIVEGWYDHAGHLWNYQTEFGLMGGSPSVNPTDYVNQSQLSCPYGTGTLNADGGGGFIPRPPIRMTAGGTSLLTTVSAGQEIGSRGAVPGPGSISGVCCQVEVPGTITGNFTLSVLDATASTTATGQSQACNTPAGTKFCFFASDGGLGGTTSVAAGDLFVPDFSVTTCSATAPELSCSAFADY